MNSKLVGEYSKGPTIHFENVSLKYNNNFVIDSVSHTFTSGEITAIVGPNGGGKSTLVKSLLGQVPHEGTIRIQWENKRQIVGYIPQEFTFSRLIPVKVADFLDLSCGNKKLFKKMSSQLKNEIDHILDVLQIKNKYYDLLEYLSGGERQRVLIAQSLIPLPNLLICDEPVTGLDSNGIDLFDSLLNRLRELGTTIVWVSHDFNRVKKLADTVVKVNKTIEFSGDCASFFQKEEL